jgi:hypothetical protein
MSTIKATRNGSTREFDLEIWKQLPENKYGWKAVADEPREVKKLKDAASDNTADPGAGTGNGDDTKVPQEKLNAIDLSKKIYEATTIEEVDALVPDGETRKTVLQAAEARKQEIANG